MGTDRAVTSDVAAERTDALRWAARVRDARAELRRAMQAGERRLDEVLAAATQDPMVAPVRLLYVLESLPGARKVDTRRHLDGAGIDGDAPVGDLDPAVREQVLADFPLGAGR